MLREELKALGRGTPTTNAQRKATFSDMQEMLRSDYRRKQNRSWASVLVDLKHLEPFFGKQRACDIDFAMVEKYINARLDAGAAHATVKGERAVLHRMLKLWSRATRAAMPSFPEMGNSENAREGIIEPEVHWKLLELLPPEVGDVADLMHATGRRLGETLALRWAEVDIARGEMRIPPSGTKQRKPLAVALPADTVALLKRRYAATMAVERETGVQMDHVFWRIGKRDAMPRRVSEAHFYDHWRAARATLKLPETTIPHNYRRGGARRMEQAGVPRSAAKRMGGWSTDAMYTRYTVVARTDLDEAAAKVQAMLEADRVRAGLPRKTGTEPVRSGGPAAAESDDAKA
jgi:integrase